MISKRSYQNPADDWQRPPESRGKNKSEKLRLVADFAYGDDNS